MLVTVLAAGALAGLASVPHCAGMCGPLAAFACARGGGRPMDPLRYQAGRMLGYGMLGAGAGALGHAVTGGLSHPTVAWLLSWAMAAALAITAYRLWRGPGAAPLVRLGRARSPAAPSLLERLTRRLPKTPLALGLMTGLLPCGALAAAVLMAAGTTSPWLGSASMVAFATVSGVGLMGVGLVARRLRLASQPALVRSLAVALALGAVLLALRPLPLAMAHGPAGDAPPDPTAACPLHAP
jgi:uncharacterized protein